MRLDKFLQVSRLVRRRTLANTLCRAGRVMVNGHPADPADRVRVGDVITVQVADRLLRARVRVVPDSRPGADREDYCDIVEGE